LFSWLVGSFVGWFFCWLVGSFVGWLVGSFVGWLVGWLVGSRLSKGSGKNKKLHQNTKLGAKIPTWRLMNMKKERYFCDGDVWY
jgi:hypothetical protein